MTNGIICLILMAGMILAQEPRLKLEANFYDKFGSRVQLPHDGDSIEFICKLDGGGCTFGQEMIFAFPNGHTVGRPCTNGSAALRIPVSSAFGKYNCQYGGHYSNKWDYHYHFSTARVKEPIKVPTQQKPEAGPKKFNAADIVAGVLGGVVILIIAVVFFVSWLGSRKLGRN